VIRWPIERDDRALEAGTAILSADSDLVAVARATWIELRCGGLKRLRYRRTPTSSSGSRRTRDQHRLSPWACSEVG